jgi:hypothetical protein
MIIRKNLHRNVDLLQVVLARSEYRFLAVVGTGPPIERRQNEQQRSDDQQLEQRKAGSPKRGMAARAKNPGAKSW